jgi:hypothetical protein
MAAAPRLLLGRIWKVRVAQHDPLAGTRDDLLVRQYARSIGRFVVPMNSHDRCKLTQAIQYRQLAHIACMQD